MTLEDFFTLTEMKNGLTTVARVEELISILQQQKDCVMSNVGDTARQWSSVASTLVATENKDCLIHFVQLNGLHYLNQWLQEACKCGMDIVDGAIEELLTALLESLERLPIKREESVSSGIQKTIEKLLEFKSIGIKEKARALFDRWKVEKDDGLSCHDMDEDGKSQDDNSKASEDVDKGDGSCSVHQNFDNTTCREGPEDGNSACPEASQQEHNDDVLSSTEHQTLPAASAFTNANLGYKTALPATIVLNSCQSLSGAEESSPVPAVEMASAKCSSPSKDANDDHCDVSTFENDSGKDTKMEVDGEDDGPCKSAEKGMSKVPTSPGLVVSSITQKPERSVSCNFDSKESKSHTLNSVDILPRSASIDCVLPKYLRAMDLKPVKPDVLSNIPKLTKEDEPESSFSRKEDVKLKGSDSSTSHDSLKAAADKRFTVEMDQRAELGLEYGEIDALEVARLVAIEVEREVVDYREPFCSPSPEDIPGEAGDVDIAEDKHDNSANEEENRSRRQVSKDDIGGATSTKDGNLGNSKTEKGPDKCEEDAEMSKMKVDASGDRSVQNKCGFDLNEDVFMEEADSFHHPLPNAPVNLSAPIAVAAMKGAPSFPVSPLRFEGELGWKGSAATSAFRPASPRKTPDAEKTSSGQKRKANFVEFDLNVAESGDDAVDALSIKPLPVSSGFPAREDSLEVNSRRADMLKLDLNRLGDEDLPLHPPSSHRSLPHQNGGDRTVSPASSSSSRHPSMMRDFDLNDNPNFFDTVTSQNLRKSSSQVSGMYGSPKLDSSFITIMGSKISERKEHINSVPQSYMGNGPSFEVSGMASRPAMAPMPYSTIPLPSYVYNGPVMGPPMAFPQPFSSSVPYMVDSRGATVVPQMIGSSAVPPFLMGGPNTLSGLNGVGTSHSGLDLNSGIMTMEMGNSNRDRESFKHLFLQGHHHNGLMEEQVRAASSQPAAAAGLSLASQREADSGWEPYPFGYRTSWQ